MENFTMIGMNLYRKVKAAVAVVKKDAYEVLQPFHHLHVLQGVGSVLMLSVEEAKYHLLGGRIKPVAKADETKSVEAPAVVAAPAPVVTDTHEAAVGDDHE